MHIINFLWTLIGVTTISAVLMSGSSFLPRLPVFRPVALTPRPAGVPMLEDLPNPGLTYAEVKAATVTVEPTDQQARYTADLIDRANAVRDRDEARLFAALVALCQDHGYTNEETYERLHDAVDTIVVGEPVTPFTELLDSIAVDHGGSITFAELLDTAAGKRVDDA